MSGAAAGGAASGARRAATRGAAATAATAPPLLLFRLSVLTAVRESGARARGGRRTVSVVPGRERARVWGQDDHPGRLGLHTGRLLTPGPVKMGTEPGPLGSSKGK